MAFGDHPTSIDRIHKLLPEMIKGSFDQTDSSTDHGAHIIATERALTHHFEPQITADDLRAATDPNSRSKYDDSGEVMFQAKHSIRSALLHYSNSTGARHINATLRGGLYSRDGSEYDVNMGFAPKADDHENYLKTQRSISELHRAFNGGIDTRLPIHVDTFHGLAGNKGIIGGLLPGQVIKTAGMLSTSIDGKVAYDFAQTKNHTHIDASGKEPHRTIVKFDMMHVKHPKGTTSGIYMDRKNTGHPGEREMLINHGTPMIFTGKSHLVFPHREPWGNNVMPHHLTIHHFEVLR